MSETASTTPASTPFRGKCATCPYIEDLNDDGLCIRCRNGLPQPTPLRTGADLLTPDRVLLADEDELIRATAALARSWQAHGFPAVATAMYRVLSLRLDDHDDELLMLANALHRATGKRRKYPLLEQAMRETNPFGTVVFDNAGEIGQD